MLAITEKWDPYIHGYTNPPDTPRKNKIMETMNFCILTNTSLDEDFNWFLECKKEYNEWCLERSIDDGNGDDPLLPENESRPCSTRKIKLHIIKSTYMYNHRLFVIINKSFLNFIKKCKNYYKNKINHYKKTIFHRSIYGRFPLYKYPRASEC